MIKLVSPKYLGNHTHATVKAKVVELLFTWTIDLKSEPKILEAYNMLKKQGVVKVREAGGELILMEGKSFIVCALDFYMKKFSLLIHIRT